MKSKESSEIDKILLEEFKRTYKPEQKTQSRKKLANYVSGVIQAEWFQDKVLEIRKKYGVPLDGYPKTSEMPLPPENLSDRWGASGKIRDEIKVICDKYHLHYLDWFSDFEYYIYYNEFYDVYEINAKNLIFVADLAEEEIDPFDKSTQIDDNKHFPIAIRISPYASQRDLIDFIKDKTIWKDEIKFLQDKYKIRGVRIGSIKTKKESIQKRNEFIYQNRELPRKRIMKMVSDKFHESLDYGHIGKIVSLEIKKRKEV